MSDAVRGTDPRCGYPKKDGSPCRNRVPAPGKVCRIHQKAALLDRILKREPGQPIPDDVSPADGTRPHGADRAW
jgi:hypothetical protein